jgi:hypothetical protein
MKTGMMVTMTDKNAGTQHWVNIYCNYQLKLSDLTNTLVAKYNLQLDRQKEQLHKRRQEL